MADHDNAYKLLFSFTPVVADLVRGFIREEWVQGLDLSTLEALSGRYITGDLRGRENDQVWRVRCGESQWVYLALEFQSTVDVYMALRVMVYSGLLYQKLVRQRDLPPSGRLPPLVSVVLYNGYRPWRSAEDVADLVEVEPSGLDRPSLRYRLLDGLRLEESELPSGRNLAAALIRMERSHSLRQVAGVLSDLCEWLRGPEHQSLREAFAVWLTRSFLPSRGVPVNEGKELQEILKMLTQEEEEFGIDFSREWVRKGRREGLEEAVQALRRVILAQLTQRFGFPSEDLRRRVEGIASLDELTSIGERILTVRSLAELGLEPTS